MLAIDGLGLELEIETRSPAARRLRVALPPRASTEEIERVERRLRAHPGIVEVKSNRRTRRTLIRYASEATLPVVDRTKDGVASSTSSDPRLHSAVDAVRDEPRSVALRALLPSDDGVPWHALDRKQVLERLGSTEQGVDDLEAVRRIRRFGPNAYNGVEPRSRLEILLAQVNNLPTTLLLGSSIVSSGLGDFADAAAIDAVVALNAAIGYRIEKKNDELIASWRKLEAGGARVVRAGAVRTIAATQLVPGDIILCRRGDILPADARVLEVHRLTCNEALLTGESEPQRKWPDPVAATAVLAERSCMLYTGTPVVSGRGHAVVVATGAGTEMARVRSLVEQERAPRAPLERRMEELGRQGTWLSLGAGGLAAVGGLLRGQPANAVLRNGIALAVAAIPEGLPVVVTAALVHSMARMRAAGMVVRRIAAAETLGGVTVVCADKTGTLTQGDMRLELLDVGGKRVEPSRVRIPSDRLPIDDPAGLALIAAVLNSDVEVRDGAGGVGLVGSSTERAFVAAAREAGLDLAALKAAFPRSLLLERSESAQFVISLHDVAGGGAVAFLKGAPEQVLSLCANDGEAPLDAAARGRVMERNEALAAQGLRILGLAWQPLETRPAVAPPGGYSFIGLAALRDPVREGAAEAVRRAERAGIRTVILTGDQRATAAAVARAVGLPGETRDGAEATLASVASVRGDALERTSVLSRVTPAQKVSIVKALRERGEIVAMIGDGINDAPALKAADIGIAVGPDAADVARQTADVVLINEDLRSILAAVGEGRIVQDNLRRAAGYLFATNLSEVALVVASAFLGQVTLNPLQLLWINLLTDTLPALAIAFDTGEPDVLDRPPAPPDAPIIRPAEWGRLTKHGLIMAALGEAAHLVGGQGAAFAALPAAQLAYSAVCRARGATHRDGFGALVGGAAALHLGAITLPPLRAILKVPPPSPMSLLAYAIGLAVPLAAALFHSEEIIVRRGSEPASSTI
jgi:P-type Ca2+ transporter type 2C